MYAQLIIHNTFLDGPWLDSQVVIVSVFQYQTKGDQLNTVYSGLQPDYKELTNCIVQGDIISPVYKLEYSMNIPI